MSLKCQCVNVIVPKKCYLCRTKFMGAYVEEYLNNAIDVALSQKYIFVKDLH